MRFSARQVAVIVILMDDRDRSGGIDHLPTFPATFVDHPVIPTGAPHREIRDIAENSRAGK